MRTGSPVAPGLDHRHLRRRGGKAAYPALVTGAFPDPVEVTLPRGARPSFALAMTRQDEIRRAPASSRMPATILT